jgi:predicted nucleotide-binding protein
MAKGYSQKKALVEEINRQLDEQGAPLTPVVRKAARLAQLVGATEHRILFDFHLDGANPSDFSGSRVQPWPDLNVQPKWDIVSAFLEDRAESNGRQVLPLEQLERLVQRMQIEQASAPPEVRYKVRSTLVEPELAHTKVLARIRNRVANFVRSVEATLMQQEPDCVPTSPLPRADAGKVFIGHGRSRIWVELKDFIQDRLGLPWDEFNRESTAGKSTKERLEEMLAAACFAFLIMTADDEHADGTLHARENVVHEIGLFQVKLGFTKAIVLLEEGCQEFSNVVGITQIRFPKDNIMAKSEEIRRVLEREGVLAHAH